jgi:CheY-like chemotaxis protein
MHHGASQGKEAMSYKLLIVDDSKLARMAVVKALNSCYPDWKRVEAASAADALRAMEGDAPHIALVDFNMPSRDGLHLAADLLKLNPPRRNNEERRGTSPKGRGCDSTIVGFDAGTDCSFS